MDRLKLDKLCKNMREYPVGKKERKRCVSSFSYFASFRAGDGVREPSVAIVEKDGRKIHCPIPVKKMPQSIIESFESVSRFP